MISARQLSRLILVGFMLMVGLIYLSYTFNGSTDNGAIVRTRVAQQLRPESGFVGKPDKTVVFFAYHEGSLLEASNLEYFAKAGVWDRTDIDFVLIVNGEKCTACLDKSSKLYLPNVRILLRENSGFDFAAYSFALESTKTSDYRYFIFINGGVRGPIVPSYKLPGISSWHQIFIEMLQGNVKLAGPTISCEEQIHVQTHMFALERSGLEVAIAANIFTTSGKSILELVRHSELGLTEVIMNNGFDISCLLLQYKSYDWSEMFHRDASKGRNVCNSGRNPNIENSYGGLFRGERRNPSVLEIVFFKRGGTAHKECPLKEIGAYGTKESCEYDILVDDLSEWTLAALPI